MRLDFVGPDDIATAARIYYQTRNEDFPRVTPWERLPPASKASHCRAMERALLSVPDQVVLEP